MMVFRITFLGEFSRDEAQIRRRYGDIPNRSDAGVFKVRISLLWRQFQLKVDLVTRRRLIAAFLVSLVSSNRRGQIFISQNSA